MVRFTHHPEHVEGSGLLVTMLNKLSNYVHPELLLQSANLRIRKVSASYEYSLDPFGDPAFFQIDRFLGAQLVTAHAIDAVAVIEAGSFFPGIYTFGRAIFHADIAVDTISIQDIWPYPDQRSYQLHHEFRDHLKKTIGRKDECWQKQCI
jgi:hypothetical protein